VIKKSTNITQIILLSLLISILLFGIAKAEIVRVFGKITESNEQGIDQAEISFISKTTGDTNSTISDSYGNYSILLDITKTLVLTDNSPQKFQLFQNFPNPFNPSTKILFSLPTSGSIKLCIYNSKAQLVNVIAEGYYPEGIYQTVWDGRDMIGEGVATGVYFYRFESDDFSQTKKMVFIDGAERIWNNNSVVPIYKPQTFSSTLAGLFTLIVKKPGFSTFVDDNFKVPLGCSQYNKDIVLQPTRYFPLNVGNSWTFSYKLTVNDKWNEITFKIIEKRNISGYDYFVFDKWPLFLPSNFTRPKLPAIVRNDEKSDLVINIEDMDALMYKFSHKTLDSTRIEHIDYNDIHDSFPNGVDLITMLLSLSDSVQTEAGLFSQCYKFYAFIGQVADTGMYVWFAPEVGPVQIKTTNVEAIYLLKRAVINGNDYSNF